ncbi:MAG TPA: glycoside hydrolase family 15 protein [Caulobacteraceae bacterium]|jgi:GH15 family glucan-1,4-alpha-glucosidase
MTASHDLDLKPIGNCGVSALINRGGRYVWACAPRFDSDPFFSNLLSGTAAADEGAQGVWSVEVQDLASVEQEYLRNTPVVRTVLTDARGAAVEVIDFCPRYRRSGRAYRPTAFVRRLRPLAGAPRISIRLRPTRGWGAQAAERTSGSNHVRYIGSDVTLRLTTNAPVSHILSERWFRLEEEVGLFLGPDEPFAGHLLGSVQAMLAETKSYWREWVRTLSVPLDWQEVVIRAAIALKLCAWEETGAIVAALTTSIPEAPDSGRNWDYRYCWIRDAYYVVQALNRLGAADLLENYLGYLRNIVDQSGGGHIQPVYGVGLEPILRERTAEALPGYRGMGPVRVGNQAHEHLQHDVYGQVVLSNVQAFFDQRLLRPATVEDFEALERVGERAFAMHDQPDAGLWEFRTIARVHTYSAVMCWAACDRLGNAAEALGLSDRAAYWRGKAQAVRERVEAEAFNTALGRFAGSFGGEELDASLLQLVDLRFIAPDDPRHVATVGAIERELMRGSHLLRYALDDFGAPETAFNFCTFWYIEALHHAGRAQEARELFSEMVARRTSAGLLSEDFGLKDGELWGNYPQTYSLVGLINCAVLLSRPWASVR